MPMIGGSTKANSFFHERSASSKADARMATLGGFTAHTQNIIKNGLKVLWPSGKVGLVDFPTLFDSFAPKFSDVVCQQRVGFESMMARWTPRKATRRLLSACS